MSNAGDEILPEDGRNSDKGETLAASLDHVLSLASSMPHGKDGKFVTPAGARAGKSLNRRSPQAQARRSRLAQALQRGDKAPTNFGTTAKNRGISGLQAGRKQAKTGVAQALRSQSDTKGQPRSARVNKLISDQRRSAEGAGQVAKRAPGVERTISPAQKAELRKLGDEILRVGPGDRSKNKARQNSPTPSSSGGSSSKKTYYTSENAAAKAAGVHLPKARKMGETGIREHMTKQGVHPNKQEAVVATLFPKKGKQPWVSGPPGASKYARRKG
jgi:hypothetical protein